jgi:hypothetical protein
MFFPRGLGYHPRPWRAPGRAGGPATAQSQGDIRTDPGVPALGLVYGTDPNSRSGRPYSDPPYIDDNLP